MSIPTPFNPMGTLGEGRLLPFVPPIMVSLTNWSNKTGANAASFGMTITTRSDYDDNPSGQASIYKAFGGESFTGYTGNGSLYYNFDIILEFEKPLLIKTLAFERNSNSQWGASRVTLLEGDSLTPVSNVVTLPALTDGWEKATIDANYEKLRTKYIIRFYLHTWYSLNLRAFDLRDSFYKA